MCNTLNKSLLADCPYGCVNGYVFLESQGRVECPHCKNALKVTEYRESEEFKSIYDTLFIPETYRNLSEKSAYACLDAINTIANQKMYGGSLANIISVYTEILNRLSVGELYRDSLYFCFTVLDTDKLVYSTQILAALNGVGTVPYITLNRLSQLLYCGDIIGEYTTYTEQTSDMIRITGLNTTLAARVHRLMGGLDYTDYTTAPLCFLELTPGTTDAGFLALRDLLAERARLSLPTYVLGFCGMYKMAANGEYTSLGQFEGSGLRKLTQLSLMKNTINRAKYDKDRGTMVSTDENLAYREIGVTKDYGIFV